MTEAEFIKKLSKKYELIRKNLENDEIARKIVEILKEMGVSFPFKKE